jgi:hypothetical protein
VVVFIGFLVMLGLFLRIGTFPLVCVVAWLPFLPAWFWDALARRRVPESPGPADDAAPAASGLSPFASTLVVLCLAYVVLCNVLTLQTGFSLSLVKGIGIEQSWGMFAPYPTRKDGWYVVDARLQNGKEVDPFRGGPVSWEKPERISAIYPSARWAAYLSLLAPEEYQNQIVPGRYSSYAPHFANYLGSRWNAEHTGGEIVESVEVYYMLRYIRSDYTATPVQKVSLAKVKRDPDETK